MRRPLLLGASSLLLAAAWLALGPGASARAQVPGRMRDVPEAPPPPPGTALPAVTPTVHPRARKDQATFHKSGSLKERMDMAQSYHGQPSKASAASHTRKARSGSGQARKLTESRRV